MTITDHIAQWKRAVAGWPFTEWPATIETNDEREYIHACGLLHSTMNAAKAAGHTATSGGRQNDSGGKAMWITANGHRLTVAYVPKPRKQAVRKTSIEAYHTINFDSARGRVAMAIMERTAQGADVTRNEIEEALGMRSGGVTGRVNELINTTKQTPLRIDGKDWQLVITGKRASTVTNEINEALRFVEWKAQQQQLF